MPIGSCGRHLELGKNLYYHCNKDYLRIIQMLSLEEIFGKEQVLRMVLKCLLKDCLLVARGGL